MVLNLLPLSLFGNSLCYFTNKFALYIGVFNCIYVATSRWKLGF